MNKDVALMPRLNEKTYGLAAKRVYVFDVDRAVNKHSIARAVESQFEVKVAAVNTANIAGKPKRVISVSGKRMKNSDGSRNDFKKAYVTLEEGHGLPFFDAIEEEEQKEQAAQEKFDKAAAKQAEKEEKAAAKTSKPGKSEAKAQADKPAAKPEKPAKKSAAKKPASKETAKTTEPEPAEKTEEKPEGRYKRLAAWRGFRLRKKNKGDK